MASASPFERIVSPHFLSEPLFGSKVLVIERYTRAEITDNTALLQQCAELFSSHYGHWSLLPENESILRSMRLKPGNPVKLSADKIREQLLFNDSCGVVIIRAGTEERLVGHAFYCTFSFTSPASTPESGGNSHSTQLSRNVRWVTQLVVSSDARGKRLASILLCQLLNDSATSSLSYCGLVSSHPAAVKALERAARSRCSLRNGNINRVRVILRVNPVPYLRQINMETALKLSDNPENLFCWIDTNFYVDHSEVLSILSEEVERDDSPHRWELGYPLPEGHEFVVVARLNPDIPDGQL